MERYKFIDKITSDVMFEAYGKTLRDVFINAAEALSSIICKLDKVKPKKAIDIELTESNVEDLMFSWLQEIIAAVDIEQMFFSKFEIHEISEKHVKAKIYGEPITKEKGETVVKSITYHQYKFEKTPNGFKVTVSCDI